VSDPLLPKIPEPGDTTDHTIGATVTLLRSFMVLAAVSSDPDSDEPGVPVVVMDLVLVDAFAPDAGAVPIRVMVEHSDLSTRALLDGLQRSISMLDGLGEARP
jgi:hypothetical protein